ncbi:hypothetical protein DESC_740069 [Desulfosarcina cetonica]|uniref:hypothetical protein n=1 Tax=Desulfosarcina cetonica TaxID=90730 RepID=UPI0006D22738|nr:hypothetical protein [Desulfosarcina cetonica]VTR69330.1 hypothetical protein DESC_740069 [Desulfosarcina cetonica]
MSHLTLLDMSFIEMISAFTLGLAAIVLTLIAGIIIKMMFQGTLNGGILNFLYENTGEGQAGKPSVSRLQMLIWNFVVAFAFLYVLGAQHNGIEAAIQGLLQPEVLILLGISNGTYLIGKRAHRGAGTGAGTDTPPEPVPAGE